MKKVNCKQCGSEIFHEYSAIESINEGLCAKKKKEKHLAELEQMPSDTCHTSIYLTCGNGHLDRYFCRIEEKS